MLTDLPPIVPRHTSKGLTPYPPDPDGSTPACVRASAIADRWLADHQELPPQGWVLVVMSEDSGPIIWPPIRPSVEPWPYGGDHPQLGPGYAIGLGLVSVVAAEIRAAGAAAGLPERAEESARALEELSEGGYFPIYCSGHRDMGSGGTWIFGVVRTPAGMMMVRGGEG